MLSTTVPLWPNQFDILFVEVFGTFFIATLSQMKVKTMYCMLKCVDCNNTLFVLIDVITTVSLENDYLVLYCILASGCFVTQR